MQGLSPRILKHMRAFAAAWRDRASVQQLVHKSPGFTTEARSLARDSRRSLRQSHFSFQEADLIQ